VRVGDLDVPAAGLERVVDQAGAGHRLDDAADGLCMDLVDSSREPLQRIDVRWNGELVEVLSLLGEQADINLLSAEIESSVQHVKRASLVLGWWTPLSVSPTEALLHGSPERQ
jgi:hypothetical protein